MLKLELFAKRILINLYLQENLQFSFSVTIVCNEKSVAERLKREKVITIYIELQTDKNKVYQLFHLKYIIFLIKRGLTVHKFHHSYLMKIIDINIQYCISIILFSHTTCLSSSHAVAIPITFLLTTKNS